MASGVGSVDADSKVVQESKIPISKQSGISKNVQESTTMKKPPLESRKSGEELKLELASAMSAKLANGGRNSSNNINSGIGYLLQRREAQENKLNTKDISFQKAVVRKGASDGKSSEVKLVRNGMSKNELQKTLLSALMSSRASGLGQTKYKTAKSAEKDKNEKPTMINDKTNANPSSNATLNATQSLQETSGIEETEISKGESNKDLSSTKTVGLKKQYEKGTTENTVLQNNANDSAKPNSSHTSGVVRLVESFEKERKFDSENGSLSRNTSTGKLVQNDIKKKTPPPVAKKPVKKLIQPLTESISSGNIQQTAPKDRLNTNTHSSTQQSLVNSDTSQTLRKTTSDVSNSGAGIPEGLLEKLEERIGSCKISIFKSTDEFSGLRVKVHRIRGDLEQLRRDREKRAVLV